MKRGVVTVNGVEYNRIRCEGLPTNAIHLSHTKHVERSLCTTLEELRTEYGVLTARDVWAIILRKNRRAKK